MKDPLTPEERSAHMAKVRSEGNQSTEMKVLSVFEANELTGWVRHPREIIGRPDFFFPQQRIALFVDGCFWHGCPKCGRIPKTRSDYWLAKIESNRRRDRSVTQELLSGGYAVMRVWEHELREQTWFDRLTHISGSDRLPPTNRAETFPGYGDCQGQRQWDPSSDRLVR